MCHRESGSISLVSGWSESGMISEVVKASSTLSFKKRDETYEARRENLGCGK